MHHACNFGPWGTEPRQSLLGMLALGEKAWLGGGNGRFSLHATVFPFNGVSHDKNRVVTLFCFSN